MGPTTFTIFDNLQSKKIDCLGQAEQNGLKHYTFFRKDSDSLYTISYCALIFDEVLPKNNLTRGL